MKHMEEMTSFSFYSQVGSNDFLQIAEWPVSEPTIHTFVEQVPNSQMNCNNFLVTNSQNEQFYRTGYCSMYVS